MVQNYHEFVEILLEAGFSMGGGSSDGIYSVINWNWDEPPPADSPIRWHTGDPDTDPWEWRMRVLTQRDDVAYAKFFFKKSGYITKEWYPYFLAVRRGGLDFEDAYAGGNVSHFAKRVYDAVSAHDSIPVHDIKRLVGVAKEDKAVFDRALVELQMRMFITLCGNQQKVSQKGEAYGWSSNVFCTTEGFFGADMFEKAAGISAEDAKAKITKQVLKINPSAEEKAIVKFIKG